MTVIERGGGLQHRLRMAACCGSLWLAATAWAAPSDFRVLTDELTDPDGLGLELQSSVARRRVAPALADTRAVQGLAELSWGLAPQWGLSLQLPASRVSGTTYGGGANVELTYIAPHDAQSGLYWGGRVELGRGRPIGEAASWEAEWRPILGCRRGDWHAVLNAGVAAAITGEDRQATFGPSAKLAYRAARSVSIGFEYYLDAGPLSHPRLRRQRQELGVLVLDAKLGEFDVNVGVGKGQGPGSDKTVLKLLLSWARD